MYSQKNGAISTLDHTSNPLVIGIAIKVLASRRFWQLKVSQRKKTAVARVTTERGGRTKRK
jgi:hypothetical protein